MSSANFYTIEASRTLPTGPAARLLATAVRRAMSARDTREIYDEIDRRGLRCYLTGPAGCPVPR